MSPNCEKGRRGQKPIAIVIHRGEGSFASNIAWCIDPKSQVSYHFLIREDGQSTQLVNTDDMAWHAGRVFNSKWPLLSNGTNANVYTVGIALSGFAKDAPTVAQITKCAQLVKENCFNYKIPLDRLHVIPHNEIRQDKSCPGARVDMSAILYLASL